MSGLAPFRLDLGGLRKGDLVSGRRYDFYLRHGLSSASVPLSVWTSLFSLTSLDPISRKEESLKVTLTLIGKGPMLHTSGHQVGLLYLHEVEHRWDFGDTLGPHSIG